MAESEAGRPFVWRGVYVRRARRRRGADARGLLTDTVLAFGIWIRRGNGPRCVQASRHDQARRKERRTAEKERQAGTSKKQNGNPGHAQTGIIMSRRSK